MEKLIGDDVELDLSINDDKSLSENIFSKPSYVTENQLSTHSDAPQHATSTSKFNKALSSSPAMEDEMKYKLVMQLYKQCNFKFRTKGRPSRAMGISAYSSIFEPTISLKRLKSPTESYRHSYFNDSTHLTHFRKPKPSKRCAFKSTSKKQSVSDVIRQESINTQSHFDVHGSSSTNDETTDVDDFNMPKGLFIRAKEVIDSSNDIRNISCKENDDNIIDQREIDNTIAVCHDVISTTPSIVGANIKDTPDKCTATTPAVTKTNLCSVENDTNVCNDASHRNIFNKFTSWHSEDDESLRSEINDPCIIMKTISDNNTLVASDSESKLCNDMLRKDVLDQHDQNGLTINKHDAMNIAFPVINANEVNTNVCHCEGETPTGSGCKSSEEIGLQDCFRETIIKSTENNTAIATNQCSPSIINTPSPKEDSDMGRLDNHAEHGDYSRDTNNESREDVSKTLECDQGKIVPIFLPLDSSPLINSHHILKAIPCGTSVIQKTKSTMHNRELSKIVMSFDGEKLDTYDSLLISPPHNNNLCDVQRVCSGKSPDVTRMSGESISNLSELEMDKQTNLHTLVEKSLQEDLLKEKDKMAVSSDGEIRSISCVSANTFHDKNDIDNEEEVHIAAEKDKSNNFCCLSIDEAGCKTIKVTKLDSYDPKDTTSDYTTDSSSEKMYMRDQIALHSTASIPSLSDREKEVRADLNVEKEIEDVNIRTEEQLMLTNNRVSSLVADDFSVDNAHTNNVTGHMNTSTLSTKHNDMTNYSRMLTTNLELDLKTENDVDVNKDQTVPLNSDVDIMKNHIHAHFKDGNGQHSGVSPRQTACIDHKYSNDMPVQEMLTTELQKSRHVSGDSRTEQQDLSSLPESANEIISNSEENLLESNSGANITDTCQKGTIENNVSVSADEYYQPCSHKKVHSSSQVEVKPNKCDSTTNEILNSDHISENSNSFTDNGIFPVSRSTLKILESDLIDLHNDDNQDVTSSQLSDNTVDDSDGVSCLRIVQVRSLSTTTNDSSSNIWSSVNHSNDALNEVKKIVEQILTDLLIEVTTTCCENNLSRDAMHSNNTGHCDDDISKYIQPSSSGDQMSLQDCTDTDIPGDLVIDIKQTFGVAKVKNMKKSKARSKKRRITYFNPDNTFSEEEDIMANKKRGSNADAKRKGRSHKNKLDVKIDAFRKKEKKHNLLDMRGKKYTVDRTFKNTKQANKISKTASKPAALSLQQLPKWKRGLKKIFITRSKSRKGESQDETSMAHKKTKKIQNKVSDNDETATDIGSTIVKNIKGELFDYYQQEESSDVSTYDKSRKNRRKRGRGKRWTVRKISKSKTSSADDSSGVKSELEEMDITEAVTSPDSPTQDESTSETKKATKKNKKCAKRLRDMGAKGPVVTDDRLTFEFSKHNWLEKKYRPSLDGDKGYDEPESASHAPSDTTTSPTIKKRRKLLKLERGDVPLVDMKSVMKGNDSADITDIQLDHKKEESPDTNETQEASCSFNDVPIKTVVETKQCITDENEEKHSIKEIVVTKDTKEDELDHLEMPTSSSTKDKLRHLEEEYDKHKRVLSRIEKQAKRKEWETRMLCEKKEVQEGRLKDIKCQYQKVLNTNVDNTETMPTETVVVEMGTVTKSSVVPTSEGTDDKSPVPIDLTVIRERADAALDLTVKNTVSISEEAIDTQNEVDDNIKQNEENVSVPSKPPPAHSKEVLAAAKDLDDETKHLPCLMSGVSPYIPKHSIPFTKILEAERAVECINRHPPPAHSVNKIPTKQKARRKSTKRDCVQREECDGQGEEKNKKKKEGPFIDLTENDAHHKATDNKINASSKSTINSVVTNTKNTLQPERIANVTSTAQILHSQSVITTVPSNANQCQQSSVAHIASTHNSLSYLNSLTQRLPVSSSVEQTTSSSNYAQATQNMFTINRFANPQQTQPDLSNVGVDTDTHNQIPQRIPMCTNNSRSFIPLTNPTPILPKITPNVITPSVVNNINQQQRNQPPIIPSSIAQPTSLIPNNDHRSYNYSNIIPSLSENNIPHAAIGPLPQSTTPPNQMIRPQVQRPAIVQQHRAVIPQTEPHSPSMNLVQVPFQSSTTDTRHNINMGFEANIRPKHQYQKPPVLSIPTKPPPPYSHTHQPLTSMQNTMSNQVPVRAAPGHVQHHTQAQQQRPHHLVHHPPNVVAPIPHMQHNSPSTNKGFDGNPQMRSMHQSSHNAASAHNANSALPATQMSHGAQNHMNIQRPMMNPHFIPNHQHGIPRPMAHSAVPSHVPINVNAVHQTQQSPQSMLSQRPVMNTAMSSPVNVAHRQIGGMKVPVGSPPQHMQMSPSHHSKQASPAVQHSPKTANRDCGHCGRHSSKYLCSGCRNIWYCTPSCQTNAWPLHSRTCS